mmetsp:Transcript_1821/g.4052  ORF Transcript_1821/g.4052 Transcript_1821/m.4052 type:complete len:161 (+) Transcript_1821:55-537(+)
MGGAEVGGHSRRAWLLFVHVHEAPLTPYLEGEQLQAQVQYGDSILPLQCTASPTHGVAEVGATCVFPLSRCFEPVVTVRLLSAEPVARMISEAEIRLPMVEVAPSNSPESSLCWEDHTEAACKLRATVEVRGVLRGSLLDRLGGVQALPGNFELTSSLLC